MNPKPFLLVSLIGLLWSGCATPGTDAAKSNTKNPSGVPGTLLAGCRRVVFLGDSITYSGKFIDDVEMVLRRFSPESEFEFLDLGLPSETVSGLTEPGHAGGAFPRPNLHDRLERLLELTKPDLVIACYGMNDGIYYPFDEAKFEAYQRGIQLLRQRVLASGAKIIHVTPPVFDPVPIRAHTLPAGRLEYRQPYEGYDNVLERYSEWLMAQRKNGWTVIDAHSPMKLSLDQQRSKNPAFLLAPDGVHLDDKGHWLLAQALLRGIQKPGARLIAAAQSPEIPNDSRGREMLVLIHTRNRMLSDSWLTTVGHKRPGMEKGLPLAEAMEKAEVLNHQIKELCSSSGH